MSDLKIQGEVSLDTSNADAAFARVEQTAGKMARGVQQQADKAGDSVKGIGDGADQAAQKLDRGSKSIIASIQRTTAIMEAGERGTVKYYEALAAQRGVSVDALRPYLNQLAEVQRRQEDASRGLVNMGMSAAQTAAALRGVPAQFTDIVTSLSSGQAPLTVLLQQGGQLKDVFGGVGPAARALGGYVAGLINPVTLLGGSLAALAVAYNQGASEAQEFQRAIIKSGNAAGTTADELQSIAEAGSKVVGTQAQFAATLAALVSSGRISADVMAEVSTAIVTMSSSGGASVEQLTKEFESLGKEPAKAIEKLNEQYHFLSAATYRQIKALEDQGRADEAATLAAKTYAAEVQKRGEDITKTLGYLEQAWRLVKIGAGEAWDTMLGVGRPDTKQSLLDGMEAKLRSMQSLRAFNESLFGSSGKSLPEQQLEQSIAQMRNTMFQETAGARRSRALRLIDEEGREAAKSLEQQRAGLRTNAEKLEAELAAHAERVRKIRAGATKRELDDPTSEVSKLLAPARLAQDEARIREQYADKTPKTRTPKGLDEGQKALEKYRQTLLEAIGADAGVLPTYAADIKAIYEGWVLSGQGVTLYQKAIEAYAAKQPAVVAAKRAEAEAQREIDRANKASYESWARQSEAEIRAAANSANNVQERVRALADESEAIIRARALNISLAEALEDVRIARLADAAAAATARGDIEVAYELEREIAARKELAKLTDEKKGRDSVDDLIRRTMQTSIGTDFAAGFDKASQSLGVFVGQFDKLIDLQKNYAAMQGETSLTEAERAAALARNSRQQLSAYASLTGAAKGFFGEHTAGYKALTTAEQVLRATELAGSLARITQIGAEASASAVLGVINQAKGDPYSAIPRMAAMAAIMAGLGYAVSGGFGSSGSFAATNTGTGTVLGDSAAQSESITKGLDALKDVDTLTMRYSAQMLDSLRSIESNIGGLAALLVQSGGLSASAAGVQTGFKRDGLGNAIASGYDMTSAVLGSIPVIGGVLSGLNGAVGKLVSGLFGTKTSIKGQGIFAGAQSLEEILAGGFDASYYTDIEKKRKTFGITTSKRLSTIYSDADAQLEDQVTKIFGSFADSIIAASGPLGLSLDDVKAKLNGFVVSIGRIDLKGLSGEQISERLTAVFSAAGDSIASAAISGLTPFQKVGEGYFETVIRVASGLEEARASLIRLGVTAIDYTKITDKQGDVAAELARDSIKAVEGMSGIADIISAIDGSASEITEAYQSLTDVRLSFRLLGLDADSVSFSLLQGAGGLQSLVDSVAAFEGGFLSEAEKVSISAAKLSKQFSNLGMSLPASASGFVSLVKGIDTSTDAGQLLLGQVLSLSGAFGDLLDALADVGSGIESEIERIKGLTGSTGAQSFAELQASFAINTAKARAGDQAAIDLLPDLSKSLLKAAEATAQSSIDVATIQAQTLASLEETLKAIKNPTNYVPGFASGGSFGGGWRVVGENGPELEATGPSRIFDASETARILRGEDGGTAAEIRAMRAELSAYREEQRIGMTTVAANTGRTARTLDSVTRDGTAINTVAV